MGYNGLFWVPSAPPDDYDPNPLALNLGPKMLITGVEYDAEHWAMEIAVAGCRFRCKGCHNPEAWDFGAGVPIDYDRLLEQGRSRLVKRFHIIGGEPLHQDTRDLKILLGILTSYFPHKPIMLFTGHEIDEIPHSVLSYCAYVKTGQYDETKPSYDAGLGYTLASNNQLLWVSSAGEAPIHFDNQVHFINTSNGRRYKWWPSAGDTSETSPKVIRDGCLSRLLRKTKETLGFRCSRPVSTNCQC